MEILFEWDALKARANLEKHEVDFEEAKTVFGDPMLISFPDEEHPETEERWISIGMSASRRLLLVVHTEDELVEEGLVIRIISCRKTTTSERRVYEEGEE